MGGGLELLSDADCGFCQRGVYVLKRLDRKGRLTYTTLQDRGAPARFGITSDQAQEQLWALDPSGRRSGWAEAVSAALDTALGLRLFQPLARVKPLGWIAARAYRWVADHRYMLPGFCSARPAA